MSAPIDTIGNVVVHENASGLDDRLVIHKVRDHGLQTGFHVLLFQDRYRRGDFFLMDWRGTGSRKDWDERVQRDWNVLVEVK